MNQANIYIVPSSFPYFCAEEARNVYGTHVKNILIVTYYSKRNHAEYNQLKNVINKNAWDVIFYIKSYRNATATHLQELLFVRKIKRRYQVRSIFSADWDSFFFHLCISSLNPKDAYHIDEGASTLEVYDELKRKQSQHVYMPKKKSFFTRFLIYISGLKYRRNNKLKMFSCFNIDSIPNVIEVTCHNLPSIGKNKRVPLEENTLLIIGFAYFCEDYMDKLIEIKREINPKRILYVPHRRETSENTKKIQSILSCKIDNRPLPIEVKVNDYPFQYEYIVGFFTTSFVILNAFFPESNFINCSPRENYKNTLSPSFLQFFQKYKKI
jgi:hypothetical protein